MTAAEWMLLGIGMLVGWSLWTTAREDKREAEWDRHCRTAIRVVERGRHDG